MNNPLVTRISSLVTSLTLLATSALADVSITDVSARQRWPWNSLVDVDFNIAGAAQGEAFAVSVSGTTVTPNGTATLHAKTFATEPIAKGGANRVVWDFGADYPDTKVDDLLVTVTATPFSDSSPVYLVVDISGGTSAASWPVRYTTAAPVHTVGQSDPCKTTELWLKRVKAGTITMGGGSSNSYKSHTCTLTNDYYLGVFSVTQDQIARLGYSFSNCGDHGGSFTNAPYRATRPADSCKYAGLRGNYYNPATASSFTPSGGVLKNLNDRTGLSFDLPTEWQWEYACRAGSTAARYDGCTTADLRYSGNSQPAADYEWYSEQGMWSEDYGTSYVDRYDPNPWGFYGMLGNVREVCVNYTATITEGDTLLEPQGAESSSRRQVAKGGYWKDSDANTCAYTRHSTDPWNGTYFVWGARICLTIKKNAQ